nr:histone-lysine n-methyltransferase, h3 lysine-4 specific [Quercus suber]
MNGRGRFLSSPRSRLSDTFKRDTNLEENESTEARQAQHRVDDLECEASPHRPSHRSAEIKSSAEDRRNHMRPYSSRDQIPSDRLQNDTSLTTTDPLATKDRRIHHKGVNNVPVGPTSVLKARRQPHIHILATSLPVTHTTTPHVFQYVRSYRPLQVLVDDDGYYILFEDSASGRSDLHACYLRSNMQTFFKQYTLDMVRYPDGLKTKAHSSDTFENFVAHRSTQPNNTGAQTPSQTTLATSILPATTEDSLLMEVEANPMRGNGSRPLSRLSAEHANHRHASASVALAKDDSFGTALQMETRARADNFEQPSTAATFPGTASEHSRQDLDDDSSMSGTTAVSSMSAARIKKCHVCNKSTDLDRMAQCQSCPRIYHTRCHKWQPTPVHTKITGMWSCYRCVKRKKSKAPASGPVISAKSNATGDEPKPSLVLEQQCLEPKPLPTSSLGPSLPGTDNPLVSAPQLFTCEGQRGLQSRNDLAEVAPEPELSSSSMTSLKTSRRLSTGQPIIEDLLLDDVLNAVANDGNEESGKHSAKGKQSHSVLARTKLLQRQTSDSRVVDGSAKLPRDSAKVADSAGRPAKSDKAPVEGAMQAIHALQLETGLPKLPKLPSATSGADIDFHGKREQLGPAKATAKRTKARIQLCVNCNGALPPFHLSESCRKCEVTQSTSRKESRNSMVIEQLESVPPSPILTDLDLRKSGERPSKTGFTPASSDLNATLEFAEAKGQDNGTDSMKASPAELPTQTRQKAQVQHHTEKSGAPTLTTKTLIQMAMCEAPDYRVQCSDVCRWIATHIPHMKRGTGRWEQNVSAVLSQNMDDGSGVRARPSWVRTYGEDGRSTWYTLNAELRRGRGQWDPVLQESVSPARILQPQVMEQDHVDGLTETEELQKDHEDVHESGRSCGETDIAGNRLKRDISQTSELSAKTAHIDDGSASDSEPISSFAKRRRTEHAAQFRTSKSYSRPLGESSTNNSDIGVRRRRTVDSKTAYSNEQVVRYQSSSDDEPILSKMLQKGVRPRSAAATGHTSSHGPLTPSLTDSDAHLESGSVSSKGRGAKQSNMNLSADANGKDGDVVRSFKSGESSEKVSTNPLPSAVREGGRLSRPSASVVGERMIRTTRTNAFSFSDRPMLEGTIGTKTQATDHPVRSFFEEYPDYHIGDLTFRAARQQEISNRLSRKQLFQMPAVYSLLAAEDLGEKSVVQGPSSGSRKTRNPSHMPLAVKRSNFNPTLIGKELHTETEFKTLEEFFDLPNDPLPVLHKHGAGSESQLAYRDGTRDEDGELLRARVFYKVGTSIESGG